MSYSNTTTRILYNGNGLSSFIVPFPYIDTTSIKVYLYDYSGAPVPQRQSFVEGVDYAIDDTGANTVIDTSGLYGAVANPLKVLIIRDSEPVQPASYAQGPFPPESVEDSFDRVTMLAQENKSKVSSDILESLIAPQTYIPSDGELVVVASPNVTIELPASPDYFATIRIKMLQNLANVIIDAGASGSFVDTDLTYTLSNNNESVTLIYNGVEWYKI